MGRQFNRAFSLGCVLLVLAGTILVLFGDFCIQAAFSAKFLPVVGMLGILAAAELFRACSYYASSLLLGRGRWQEYLAGSLLFCVPILAVAWSLFPILADIRAALIAYASGGCITLVLLLLLLRRREGICLTRGNQVALAAGLACLALAHLLRQSPWWARTTCAAVVVTGGGLRVLGMWRYPFANAIAATVRSRTQRP
jgi:O-antigen/teichoic acid export membrane protein